MTYSTAKNCHCLEIYMLRFVTDMLQCLIYDKCSCILSAWLNKENILAGMRSVIQVTDLI